MGGPSPEMIQAMQARHVEVQEQRMLNKVRRNPGPLTRVVSGRTASRYLLPSQDDLLALERTQSYDYHDVCCPDQSLTPWV